MDADICGIVWDRETPHEVTCRRPRGHEGNCAGVPLEGDVIGAHGKHLTHVPEYMRKPPREKGAFHVEIEFEDGTTEQRHETSCDRPATALRRAITALDYRRDILGARIIR